jgi:hypothetical protein
MSLPDPPAPQNCDANTLRRNGFGAAYERQFVATPARGQRIPTREALSFIERNSPPREQRAALTSILAKTMLGAFRAARCAQRQTENREGPQADRAG